MEARKKSRKDRWDGWFLKTDPLHVIMPYLFGGRTENEAVLGEVMDLTEVDKYLAAKNARNPEFKYTVFHFISAALARPSCFGPR